MADKLKKSNLMTFLCQYCGQPLKIDFSFSKLDQNTYNELLGLVESREDGGGGLEGLHIQQHNKNEALVVNNNNNINNNNNNINNNNINNNNINNNNNNNNDDVSKLFVKINTAQEIDTTQQQQPNTTSSSSPHKFSDPSPIQATTPSSILATTPPSNQTTLPPPTQTILPPPTQTFALKSSQTPPLSTQNPPPPKSTQTPPLSTQISPPSTQIPPPPKSTPPPVETTFIGAPTQMKLDSSLGFVLLGESEMHNSEVLSRKMLVMVELFDLLSGRSSIDHPLCQECTDCLLDQLDAELRASEDEYNAYSGLLEEMMMIRGVNQKDSNNKSDNKENNKKEDDGDDDDDDDDGDDLSDGELDREIEALEREERELEGRVVELEGREGEVVVEMKKERELQAQLDRDSLVYHRDYNEYKRQLYEYETAQKSVDYQLKYTSKQLTRLKGLNVYNLAFRIWHNDHFGTINGLRLGRLPTVPVDWNEINAAWGQTVLLLKTLADDVGFSFQRYKLVPYGNQSHLESLQEKSKELPLYGVGGFKFFWDTKFDQAMVAFLDCFQQFKEELERLNAECCLPYRMEKGRIEDPTTGISYSIKIQFNSEEQWSKALKFMLTNLKWALVWVASRGVGGGGGE